MTTKDQMVLSEREKEALRLLLVGHDAKSIANTLGLSVHTVNDRLRDARRKLGVSSSREAARRLAEMDGDAPNFIGAKEIGDAEADYSVDRTREPASPRSSGQRLAWLTGGMLIMSLIIAAVALSTIGAHNDAQVSAQTISAAAPALARQKPHLLRANGPCCSMTNSGMRAGDRRERCSRRNLLRRNGPQRSSLSDSHSGRLHHAPCRARCSRKRCPARQQVTIRYFSSRRALPTSPMRSKPLCSLANRSVGASTGTLSADV